MLGDKERVKEYVEHLKACIVDLCHCDNLSTEMWVERAKALKLINAWWDYMVLVSQAIRYIRRNCPHFLNLFLFYLKKVRF